MTVSYSSKTTGPVVTKLYIEHPGAEGTKNCSNTSGHMTSMAAMPMYGKNHIYLLRNQLSDVLEP